MFDSGRLGNDTIPRMSLDLNHLLYFHDPDTQNLSPKPLRNVLHIIDSEGYGLLRPTLKAAGVALGERNPLLVDACGARLVGFDPMKVRVLRYRFSHEKNRFSVPLTSLWEARFVEDRERKTLKRVSSLGFAIPDEWKNAAV